MVERLLNNEINIYYTGAVLYLCAKQVNINITQNYDYENVNKVFARYNGINQKAAEYGRKTSAYAAHFYDYFN